VKVGDYSAAYSQGITPSVIRVLDSYKGF
jgi:hypothetical protein